MIGHVEEVVVVLREVAVDADSMRLPHGARREHVFIVVVIPNQKGSCKFWWSPGGCQCHNGNTKLKKPPTSREDSLVVVVPGGCQCHGRKAKRNHQRVMKTRWWWWQVATSRSREDRILRRA